MASNQCANVVGILSVAFAPPIHFAAYATVVTIVPSFYRMLQLQFKSRRHRMITVALRRPQRSVTCQLHLLPTLSLTQFIV